MNAIQTRLGLFTCHHLWLHETLTFPPHTLPIFPTFISAFQHNVLCFERLTFSSRCKFPDRRNESCANRLLTFRSFHTRIGGKARWIFRLHHRFVYPEGIQAQTRTLESLGLETVSLAAIFPLGQLSYSPLILRSRCEKFTHRVCTHLKASKFSNVLLSFALCVLSHFSASPQLVPFLFTFKYSNTCVCVNLRQSAP